MTEERLYALIDLRKIFINGSGNKFQMVINRSSIYEGAEDITDIDKLKKEIDINK